MFEALKKLWNKDPLVTEKPIVVKTNISEPVISFVNAVKKDPKRFKINKESTLGFHTDGITDYSVYDTATARTFYCTIHVYSSVYTGIKKYVYGKSEPWLTDEEVLYVVKELEDFFKDKVERVKKKIEKRARERLTKLYKGE